MSVLNHPKQREPPPSDSLRLQVISTILVQVALLAQSAQVQYSLSLINHIHLIRLRIPEHIKIMPQQFHLHNSMHLGIHRFNTKLLGTDNLNLFVLQKFILHKLFLEVSSCLLLIDDLGFIFAKLTLDDFLSTRSMDTYISLLTCSERIMFPFTGMVTSIFCLSFSTLKVT